MKFTLEMSSNHVKGLVTWLSIQDTGFGGNSFEIHKSISKDHTQTMLIYRYDYLLLNTALFEILASTYGSGPLLLDHMVQDHIVM